LQELLVTTCVALDEATPPQGGWRTDAQIAPGTGTSIHAARKVSPEGLAASVGLKGLRSGVVTVPDSEIRRLVF